jgi:hypothetical protein
VQRLRTELEDDPGQGKRRQAQAQQRAARDTGHNLTNLVRRARPE